MMGPTNDEMRLGFTPGRMRYRATIPFDRDQEKPLPMLDDYGADLGVYDELHPRVKNALQVCRSSLDCRRLITMEIGRAVALVIYSDDYWNKRILDMVDRQNRAREWKNHGR